MPNYINFIAGKHPKLPFEGHEFLRFISKVSKPIPAATKVDSYINTVARIAQTCFGSCIQCWNEGADEFGVCSWNGDNESKDWTVRLSRSRTSLEKVKVSLPVVTHLRALELLVRSRCSRLNLCIPTTQRLREASRDKVEDHH